MKSDHTETSSAQPGDKALCLGAEGEIQSAVHAFDPEQEDSVSSMGQHLGKKEYHADVKASSLEHEDDQPVANPATAEPESQDEVFGLSEADVNQNNGCVSEEEEKPAVTDSAEGPRGTPWPPASAADPEGPRPHLVRLFSRDAPGREDNTFKDRPSESDELQTIQEHSAAGSECGSESAEQDLD